MRDMHCHILPGVDDGASNLQESLAMLEAAKQVGITSIVCTPHAREPYFDYDAMCEAFDTLVEHANGFPLSMGFEVNYLKLMELGFDWVDRLALRDSGEFLLELQTGCTRGDFEDYKRAIYEIQGCGYQVIIAHPERYLAIQQDIDLAYELVDMGCQLQASTDFVAGGRFGKELKPAKKMLKAGLYTYFASDAHFVEHYSHFARAHAKFGDYLPDWVFRPNS